MTTEAAVAASGTPAPTAPAPVVPVAPAPAPVVEATPIAAPGVTQPAVQPEPVKKPIEKMTRGERRREAYQRGMAEEARRRAQSQPRQPAGKREEPTGKPVGGQFTAEQIAEGAQAVPEAGAPLVAALEPAESKPAAAEAPVAASPSGPVVAPSPTGTVKIPLEEGHPLRARGISEWETPADRENETRGMLKAMAERHRLERENEDIREQLARANARLTQTGKLPYQPNAKIEHLLAEISEKYSPEDAALVKQGLDALNERALREAEMGAVEQTLEQRVERQFVDHIIADAPKRFEVWTRTGQLDGHMQRLLNQYGELVARRNVQLKASGRRPAPPTREEFIPWAMQAYAVDPAVQHDQRARTEAEIRTREERIRAEERERIAATERTRLEDAAKRHATRPPATSSHATTGAAMDSADASRQSILNSPNRRQLLRRQIGQRFTQ